MSDLATDEQIDWVLAEMRKIFKSRWDIYDCEDDISRRFWGQVLYGMSRDDVINSITAIKKYSRTKFLRRLPTPSCFKYACIDECPFPVKKITIDENNIEIASNEKQQEEMEKIRNILKQKVKK